MDLSLVWPRTGNAKLKKEAQDKVSLPLSSQRDTKQASKQDKMEPQEVT
jgi:hypothetical protein